MKLCRWIVCVIYFLITNISHNQAIRHRIFKENPRCRIEKTLSPTKLDYTFYSIFSAYRRYRLYRLKIRHETLYEVKNSTVNSSFGQQPLEILFTIL